MRHFIGWAILIVALLAQFTTFFPFWIGPVVRLTLASLALVVLWAGVGSRSERWSTWKQGRNWLPMTLAVLMMGHSLLVFVLFALGGEVGCDFDSRVSLAQAKEDSLATAARIYCSRNGTWPTSMEDMVPPSCKGKLCLLEKPIVDPWGRPFRFEIEGRSLVITSAGPNGVFEVNGDDIRLVVDAPDDQTCVQPGEKIPRSDGISQ